MIRSAWATLCRVLIVALTGILIVAALILTWKLPGAGAALIGLLMWRRFRSWRGPKDSHGSSRFADARDVFNAGLFDSQGYMYGTAELLAPPPPLWAFQTLLAPSVDAQLAVELFLASLLPRRFSLRRLVRQRSPVHSMVVAKTGRGKSTKVFINQLLSVDASMVIIDPKCEFWDKASAPRIRKFRHRCYRVDPFGLAGPEGDSLNPMSFIDITAGDFLDAARDLASAIVIPVPEAKEPHWDEAATIVITAGIVYVCACEPDPARCNLITVRDILSARPRYLAMVEQMQKVEGFDGVVAQLGAALTWFQGEELGSVLTHVNRHMAFLGSPDVADCVRTSTFHPRVLRSGKADVFFCLPSTRLRTLAPLQRLWLSTVLRVLNEGKPNEKTPVQFLIDEAAHIGRIPSIEDAVTLMRGSGIRLWFAFQGLGQVKECYGERASAFLDNIDTQLYFGIGPDTAEILAKRLGDKTILIESLNESTSQSRPTNGTTSNDQGQRSTSRSITVSAHGRPLARQNELEQMDDSVGLLLHRNISPVPIVLIEYFRHQAFRNGGTGQAKGFGIHEAIGATAALVLAACLAVKVMKLPVPRSPARVAGQRLLPSPRIAPYRLPPARRYAIPNPSYRRW